MGQCASGAGAGIVPMTTRSRKLTREQCRMLDKYLPSFCNHFASTEAHRQTAADHWNAVFNVAASSRSSRTTESSATTTGRSATSAAPMSSKITHLYDTFYEYLHQHSPELKHVFRSSMHVRGKVLVHISVGMRTILASEFVMDKAVALTRTHLRFGVKLEYFNPLGVALMYAMKESSGDLWTPEVEDAWYRLFAHCSAILMVHHMKAQMQKEELKHAQEEAEVHPVATPEGPALTDVHSSPGKPSNQAHR